MFKEGKDDFHQNEEPIGEVVEGQANTLELTTFFSENNLSSASGSDSTARRLDRRDFLKAAAALGAAAAIGSIESKSSAAENNEKKEAKEKISERKRLQDNLRMCFLGQNILPDCIDAGNEGLIVGFKYQTEGEQKKDEPEDIQANLGFVRFPVDKFSKCNDRLEVYIKNISNLKHAGREQLARVSKEIGEKEATAMRKSNPSLLLEHEGKFYQIDSEAVGKDKKLVVYLAHIKKSIGDATNRALGSMVDIGDEFSADETTVADLKSQAVEEKINSDVIKFKDGTIGYRKTLRDKTVKYIKFGPAKDIKK